MANGRIFATMPGAKVTCTCGAIYEVIKTKGPSRDAQPFKCCLCDGNYSHGREITLANSALSGVLTRIRESDI